MKDFKIDNSGDVVFEGNEIQLSEDEIDIIQSVRIILQTRQGEFFLDTESGTTHDNLFEKRPNFSYIEQDISEAILEQEKRVKSVDNVSFLFDESKRNMSIQLTMTATTNDTIESEVMIDAE